MKAPDVKLPDVRLAWMRRYDLSWVEVIFCAAIVIGGVVTVVTPAHVARIMVLTGTAASYPLPALIIAILATACVFLSGAITWGPVRVDRATARWSMSGPAPRHRPLRRRLIRVGLVTTSGCACSAALYALLFPAASLVLVAVGVVAGATVVAAAYIIQVIADRRRGTVPAPVRSLSLNTLHRNSFAPDDGYAGAVGLAATMMDISWLLDARVVRWQRRHLARASRPLTLRPLLAVAQWDARRVCRHPDALIRWALCLAAVLALGHGVAIAHGIGVMAAALTYCAGNAMSGGLRTASTTPGIRRALALDDRHLSGALMVVPTVALVGLAGAAAVTFGLGWVQLAILVVGVTFAVWRRGTRPPLPYESPIVTDSLATGAAVQPMLIASQLRGVIATVITGLLIGV